MQKDIRHRHWVKESDSIRPSRIDAYRERLQSRVSADLSEYCDSRSRVLWREREREREKETEGR